MALIDTGPLWVPQITFGPTASAPSLTSLAVSGAGRKFAAILQAPKTGSIRKVHFRTGAVTTGTDTDCRIESVDGATGDPSGTLFGTNTNVTILAASLVANTWITSGALTADAAVTQGDLLAVVLTPTGTPNYNVSAFTVGTSGVRFPYQDLYNGTAWTKDTSSIPSIALEYSDGTFAPMHQNFPITAANTHTFNSGSTPDEYALRFQFPVPVKVGGFWIWADTDGDFDAVLYDSDGTTVLASKSFDKDNRQGTGIGHHFLALSSSASLAASTYYRFAIRPSTATSLTIYSMDVNAANIFDNMPGGQLFHHSTRTDAGSWTDTTTRRLFMGLMVTATDNGVGGGGSTPTSYGYAT